MKYINKPTWKWMFLIWLGWCPSAWSYQLHRLSNGTHVKWKQNNIKYRIHKNMSNDLPRNHALQAIQDSFITWQRSLHHNIKFQFDGFSDATAGYDNKNQEKNENLLLWEEKQWNHSPNIIAITLVTYKKSAGTIVDADIVFNGVQYKWMRKISNASNTTYEQPLPNKEALPIIDLQNTVTHEIGHFLGIGHSLNTSSAMYESQIPGETSKRHLHVDDHNAVEALYTNLSSSFKTPHTQQTTEGKELPPLPPPLPSWSCSTNPAEQIPNSKLLLFLGLLLLPLRAYSQSKK